MTQQEPTRNNRWHRFWRKPPSGTDRSSGFRSLLAIEQLEGRLMLSHTAADHVHARLTIVLDGQTVPIPAQIGLSAAGHFNPHTHDTDGILHIGEGGPAGLSNEVRFVTLRDFFDVWRERGGLAGNNSDSRFDATHILNRTADSTHVVQMLVNGQLNTQFEQYTPHDDDEIVIRYDTLPATPSGLALAAASDSGFSNSDRVTSATSWQIQVSGVTPGALVELRGGGRTLGQSTAAGSTVTITAAVGSLSDGIVSLTAVQTAGGIIGSASAALPVTLDRAAPQFTLASRAVLADQSNSFDIAAPEEGQPGFRYSMLVAPPGVAVAASTGIVTFAPAAANIGRYTLSVRATDAAGNTRDLSADLFVVENAFPWRNPVNQLDVNGDSIISALDVLLMVNRINSVSTRQLPTPTTSDFSPPFYDVTRDNLLTPLDVLQVVNFINSQAAAEQSEGSASGSQLAYGVVRSMELPSLPELFTARPKQLTQDDEWDHLLEQLAIDQQPLFKIGF